MPDTASKPEKKMQRDKPIPAGEPLHGVGLAAELLAALDRARKEQSLTKAAVCERMGVAPARMTEWLRGEKVPGLETLERWTQALGLRVVLKHAEPASIDPASLSREVIEEVVRRVETDSRRSAKRYLRQFLPGDGYPSAADLDLVLEYAKKNNLEK